MMVAEELRTETAALLARLEDARGCVHVDAAGVMFTHDASMTEDEICIENSDFGDAAGELREAIAEAADRIDVLTAAAEQLHYAVHGATSLALCPRMPCAGLLRAVPNARGVIPQ